MPEPIDIAYVEIRPLTTGFGAATKRGVTKELGGIGGAATAANSNVAGLATGLGLLGGTAARAGAIGAAGAITGIGVAAGLAAASTVKAAIAFEDSFAGVRKTVDATVPELNALGDAFLDLSTKIPISADELNAIGAAAGALGIEKDAILDFTDTVAKLAVTTDLTSDIAADALARIANITQLPADQFDNLGSTLVDLGNKTASTESEIVDFALRIAGAGKQIGLTQAEILGFGAALASTGLNAEAGGTAISTTFIKIAAAAEKGGAQIKAFADVAGQGTAEFADQFQNDPAAAIVAFVEGLGRVKEEGGSVFATLDKLGLGGIRVRDALLRASGSGKLLEDSLATANKAFAENAALQREAAIRFETTASQIQLMKNNVRALQIEIGEGLLPVVASGVNEIADIATALRDSGDAAETGKTFIKGLKELIGPLILQMQKVGPTVKEAFGDLSRIFRTVLVAATPLRILIGVTMAAAFRVAIEVTGKLIGVVETLAGIFRDAFGLVITAIDTFLGSFSTLAGVVNKILPGNPLAGVQEGIDTAREDLRSFKDELEAIDGKTITTEIQVVAPGEGNLGGSAKTKLGPSVTEAGTARGPGGGGGDASVADAGLTGDVPELIRIRDQRLKDQVEIARLRDEQTDNDKKALRNLIAFSEAQAKNVKLARDVRRQFTIQALTARDEIRRIDAEAAAAAKEDAQDRLDSAKEAKEAAEERADAATAEREGILAANLALAKASKATLADDKRALNELIAYYTTRAGILGQRTAAGRQALAQAKGFKNELADISAQLRSVRAEERLDRLKDNTTLASLTRGTTDDEIKALIAERNEYQRRVNASKKNSAERRKWLIELQRTKNELEDVRKKAAEASDAGKGAFAKEAFGFMQRQQGFVSNLLGNIIPGGATAGLVGAPEGSRSGTTSGFAGGLGDDGGVPVGRNVRTGLAEAQAAGDSRTGLTAGQANQLIALQRAQLAALIALRDGSSFPEAGGNVRRARAEMEMI